MHTYMLTYIYIHTHTYTYIHTHTYILIHTSIIHSFLYGHFYSASSNPLLLRGALDYGTDTVSEFNAEAHRQL